MKKRLMVLGSMDEFVDLVKMAREKGFYTIVCDGYPDGPAKVFADESFDIDVRNIDAIAELCQSERVDGIIASFSDLLAECLVNIAHKAGLPCYSQPERFRYLREKRLMKQMFDDLGIPSPKSIFVRKETCGEDLESLVFPCVVKPANGYGSRGVYVVESAEEVERVFDDVVRYSAFDHIVVEPYNNDNEFNMMTWIVDGDPVVISIADREKSEEIPGAIPHVSRIVYPSRFTAEVLEEARRIAGLIASYVGIEMGPLSVQFFYSPERGIEVCEAAGRLFGYEHELVTYSCGLSIEELLLNYVFDQDKLKAQLVDHSPFLERISAGVYFHGHEGLVNNVDAVASLDKLPGVEDVMVYYAPGDMIGHGVGAKPYVVRCYLTAESRSALDELTAQIYDQAAVLDSEGRDLLYKNQLPRS